MPRVESLRALKGRLARGRDETASVSPLDGGLLPNDALDHAERCGPRVAEPDDLVRTSAGELFVSSGDAVLRLDERGGWQEHAVLPGRAGALALDAAERLLVSVAGHGLARVDGDGAVEVVLGDVGGRSASCITAIAVAGDGTVFLTEGSADHAPADWVRDLMRHGRTGRAIRLDPDTGGAEVVAHGLAHPTGVSVVAGQSALLVAEAWTHRILRVPLDGGPPEVVAGNLPAYPGRLSPAAGGGHWVAFFALRTHLVDFVLTQDAFRDEMVRSIEPDHWIRPALRTLGSGLEPLQAGQIRKRGVIDPWAPPRSYGLVARIDDDGDAVASFHSRPGGRFHGITAAREHDGVLDVASQGGDQVLRLRLEEER
jgi:hypothetical protein